MGYDEEAVKQRLSFEETVNSVQEGNLRYSEEKIEESINEGKGLSHFYFFDLNTLS